MKKSGGVTEVERKWGRRSVTITLLVALLIVGQRAAIAQTPAFLRLTDIDISAYPEVRLQAIIADDRYSPITNLDALTIIQNGEQIEQFEAVRVAVGVETIFVIDGNRRLLQTDFGNELSRREIVRNAVARYATDFMGGDGLDRAHIVAPFGDGSVGFLAEDAASRAEIVSAINDYEPESLPALSPLAQLIDLALAKAGAGYDEGRFQALIIFTDGADWDQQIYSPDIVAAANALNMPIYAVILGNAAESAEIINVRRLYGATNGFYVHMPQPIDADPLFTALQANATQSLISYRSPIGQSGEVDVTLSVSGLEVSGSYDIELQSPTVEIISQNDTPIIREGTAFNTPLGELQPTQAEIVAKVAWEDGYPRQIGDIRLWIDGQRATPLNQPQLDAAGTILLNWAIGGLGGGEHALYVEVTDELGLSGRSLEKEFAIELLRPPLEATPIPSPTLAPTPIFWQQAVATAIKTPQQDWLPWLGGIFVVATVALWGVRRRRRHAEEELIAAFLKGEEDAGMAEEQPVPILAYLEMLTPMPVSQRIPLTDTLTTIGRDEEIVDLILYHPSVSRLHARIQQMDGGYWLYDEGSAAGTYRNFDRLGLTPQQLSEGDTIHIGQIQLAYRLAKDGETLADFEEE